MSKKYRPVNLDGLIGQDAVVNVLKNSINNKMIPNAFLFHGIRGVGKTTAARVLARCLNCLGEDGNCFITVNPCGKCKSCVALNTDSHMDVLEIDAASKTGVDDIRVIIDSAQYVPVLQRFRIFIIDEVHMLSKSAFNALLKTLEEPPEHVKFIFATTEVQKVPDTILSRCMVCNLRPVPTSTLTANIINIAKAEGYEIDQDAAKDIACEACGSVRDSLSILEQAMFASVGDKKISTQCITEIIGGTRKEDIMELFDLAISAKTDDTADKVQKIMDAGADPYIIFKNLQDILYEKIVIACRNKDKDLTKLLYIWQIFADHERIIKTSTTPAHVLFATVIIVSHTMSFDEIEHCEKQKKETPILDKELNLPENKSQSDIMKKIVDNFCITNITELE